jgi:dipeptidyl aminopeptidase/acylaminoacyl peptidase
MLTEGVTTLIDVWDDGSRTVWHEARPSEGGRQPLAVIDDNGRRDLLDPPFSARSSVHEYGGGAAWVEDGVAWFVNSDDQRVWRVAIDGTTPPEPLTPEPAEPRAVRYADLRRSPCGRWVIAVRERHSPTDPHHVVNDVVVLAADRASEPMSVFGGTDFAMSPRFVADDRIRLIAWDHPNMPWNDTKLVECRFDPESGEPEPPTTLAEGAAFMQPVGDTVISDRDGYWNLWRISSDGRSEQLTTGTDEVGGPAWVFGLRDHGALADGRRVWATGGTLHVEDQALDTGAAALEQLSVGDDAVTCIVRSADQPATLMRFDLSGREPPAVVVEPPPLPVDSAIISRPRRIEFPTADGTTAFGWFYEPVGDGVTGPSDDAPPLVVVIHGGPTGSARPWFSLEYQFWTSRGFAIVDVDHRGSTGYGTEFRNLLDGNWGVVDVEDCIAAAKHLADTGSVDRYRMVIRGGSAGGFTVLSALAHSDVFAAGASLYGVADLSLLAADSHKFESRYLDRLVGPWPEARELYEERSPSSHLERFDTPLIVFQGLDDKVVPPNQSEMIVDALTSRGVECEYHVFEGEGHGFRKASTIVTQLNAEVAFYRRVLELA